MKSLASWVAVAAVLASPVEAHAVYARYAVRATCARSGVVGVGADVTGGGRGGDRNRRMPRRRWFGAVLPWQRQALAIALGRAVGVRIRLLVGNQRRIQNASPRIARSSGWRFRLDE